MTRVLMTADAVGGVWTYALELAHALAPQGVQTTLATMGPRPSPTQLAEAARIPDLRVEIGDFALEWMLDRPTLWDELGAAAHWLLEVESRVRPDVIHLNGYAHVVLPFHVPVVAVGHSCVMSWREANGGEFDPIALATYQRIVATGLHAAGRVVAPTSAMLASLQQHYGPLARAVVIPNGRDPACVHSAAKEPLIATAGRLWDRAKNAAAVRAVEPDLAWPVALAGTPTPGAPQQPSANVLDLLARASIFALPARYEPFGLLPLEAALAGCALVLGDIPSLREVWGDAAIYVDPGDQLALKVVLAALIADPDLLQSMAARARHRASMYSPRAMAARYLTLYTSLGESRRCA